MQKTDLVGLRVETERAGLWRPAIITQAGENKGGVMKRQN